MKRSRSWCGRDLPFCSAQTFQTFSPFGELDGKIYDLSLVVLSLISRAGGPGCRQGDELMAMFRVKAFFMHEHEAAAAKRAEEAATLTDTEWTDGYVLGVVDEKHIPQLAKA